MHIVGSALRSSVVWSALFSMLCSCGGLEDCPGAADGAHIRLEILGEIENPPADLADSIECGKEWGIVTGLSIEGTVTRHAGNLGCKPGVLEAEVLPGWTWAMGPNPFDYGSMTLTSTYWVNDGTCFAGIDLELTGERQGRRYCNIGTDGTCFLKLAIARDNSRPGNGECPEHCGLYLSVRPSLL